MKPRSDADSRPEQTDSVLSIIELANMDDVEFQGFHEVTDMPGVLLNKGTSRHF